MPTIIPLMPRFVIQHHRLADQEHWDLMFEVDSSLKTWQIPIPPYQWSGQPTSCRQLPPHRLEYLTYQGPVSQNRGHVQIAAGGTYKCEKPATHHWHLAIESDNIRGNIYLEQIVEDKWTLTFTGVTV